MAFWTHLFFQKLLNALHALVVLDLVEGVEHCCGCTVVSHVQLAGRSTVFIFRDVKDMPFFHRAVIDDFLFPVGKLAERDIGTYAHFPTDIGHQRPHKGIPRRNSTLVYGFVFIGDKRRSIDGSNHSRTAAMLASSCGIESKVLCSRREKMLATFRAHQLTIHSSHVDAGLNIVTIRTTVAGKARKHQPQTVQQFRSRAEGRTNTGD